MVFLDTSVLLYRISDRPADRVKRASAELLLDRHDCALSLQVLDEFLHRSTRRNGPGAILVETAWKMVASWRRFPIQDLTLVLLDQARGIQSRTNYTIWDSLIVAAAQAQGCETLYTEDMQDGRIIDRLRIVNPFL